jgi:flagellar basal body P-ring formation protein FlgA
MAETGLLPGELPWDGRGLPPLSAGRRQYHAARESRGGPRCRRAHSDAALRWHGSCLGYLHMQTRASKIRHWALFGLLCAVTAHGQQFESIERIEGAARHYAQQQWPDPGAGRRLIVGPLDERLRLAPCAQELAVQKGPGSEIRDRLLLQISCPGPSGWRTYVPARLAGMARAVTLKHAMMTGQVVTKNDLDVVDGDPAQFPLGYFQDTAQVEGSTLRRATAGGVVLSNQMLLSSGTIVRGQAVTLLANAGGVAVRMSGRALGDGAINQRIKVRNDSSGRIVEGIARSQQLVEINP